MVKRKGLVRLTEVKALSSSAQKKLKGQFHEILEIIFKAELETLLSEYHKNYTVKTTTPFLDQDKALFIASFYEQDLSYIAGVIRSRLKEEGIFVRNKQTILDYLKDVDSVFRAKLAKGEDISAIPFIGKAYAKKVGRPRKTPPKRYHERRYLHPNGKLYKSISEAAKENHESYSALRQAAWRDMKKNENSI